MILDGLDFEIDRGESFVILGRSGSGKSVTLRLLNGLDKPDAGQVLFDGTEISALEERDLFAVRRRMAMLFQSGALFDSMTVLENIGFPMREHTRASARSRSPSGWRTSWRWWGLRASRASCRRRCPAA